VWLKGTHLHTSHPTPKLRPKRFGPFEITEQLSSVTYRLNLPPSWKLHNTFHTTLLSPYQEMAIHRKNYPTPAPKLINGEWEWEVESILASQHHGRKEGLQYLIKWVGYPEAENSWEPAENIHALKLAWEFHKRYLRAVRNIKLECILVPEGRPSNPHPVCHGLVAATRYSDLHFLYRTTDSFFSIKWPHI